MRTRAKQLTRLLGLLLAFALIAAACGGDDDDATPAPADEPTTDATDDDGGEEPTDDGGEEPTDDGGEEPTDDGGEEPTDDGGEEPTDDGGEEPTDDGNMADDSLEPVKIGMINQEEEFVVLAEARPAAEAAAGYINTELGGVDGHPVEIVICGAGDTPESALACAQEFANDDDINIVFQHHLNSTATNETLLNAGVASLNFFADFPDVLTPGVATIDPGLLGFPQAWFQHAAENGTTEATLLIADDPFFASVIPVFQLLAAEHGIDLTDVVNLGFEPDLTGPVSAANTDHGAWFFFLADPGQCTAAAIAVNTVGFEGTNYSLENCLDASLIANGDFDGWISPYATSTATSDGPGSEEANRILSTYGGDDAVNTGVGGFALANLLVAYEAVVAAGGADADGAAISAALGTFTSETIPGVPSVSCPGPGAWIGACNPSPLMAQVVDGELVALGYIEVDFTNFDALLEG